jgi:REP element-mobilizing transposase RayT
MTFDPHQHKRQTLRLETHDYSSPGAYFVTVCAQGRDTHWFGTVARDGVQLNGAGEMLHTELERLTSRFTNLGLDVFVIMPDHIHAIFVLRDSSDDFTPHNRRGELHVRPGPPASPHRQPPDPSSPSESTRGDRTVQGEHTVRPYARVRENVHPRGTQADSIGRIVQLFKTFTTQEYIRGVRELGWQPFEKRLWQRNYFEHVVRDANDIEVKRNYVLGNPARWLEGRGLV